MSDDLQDLLRVLDVEADGDWVYRGLTPPGRRRRVYGGQVLAQAIVAASRRVPPDRRIHSLHAYFLRPGDPAVPIRYEVDPIRDGRRFSTRRVVARQHDKAIFHTSMSYDVPDPGLDHQEPMPEVPGPETVENDFDFHTRMAKLHPEHYRAPQRFSIDYRPLVRLDPVEQVAQPPSWGIWMRTAGPMPDDPVLHHALLAFMSDSYLMSTSLLPHGLHFDSPRIETASLDHGLWFYDDFRADEWLYYHIDSPRAARGRGFNVGRIYTADGRLVATAVQEGLMRLRADPLPA